MTSPPSARSLEEQLLDRCVAVARDGHVDAENECEANVFQLAENVIESFFVAEAELLWAASERYFAQASLKPLAPGEAIKRGWIVNLPRLRAALVARLNEPRNNQEATGRRGRF